MKLRRDRQPNSEHVAAVGIDRTERYHLLALGDDGLTRGPAVVALALMLGMYLTAAGPLWFKMCVAFALFAVGAFLLDPQMIRDVRTLVSLRPVSEGGAAR